MLSGLAVREAERKWGSWKDAYWIGPMEYHTFRMMRVRAKDRNANTDGFK